MPKSTMARRGRSRSRRPNPGQRLPHTPDERPVQARDQREGCPWATLPLELREMIFGVLEADIQAGAITASAYASVCKSWRGYFEPLVFRRLTLTLERLNELEARVDRRQRQFVQHICFRFERSVRCRSTDIQFRPELDALRFHTAMYQLFLILADWPSRDAGRPGIALELTAFSAIDPDYSMKDTVPKELIGVDLTVDSKPLTALYNRPPKPMRALTAEETEESVRVRHFHRPGDVPGLSDRTLPQATLITGLTVRRQMHVNFFTPHVGRIVGALPKLEFLTYEPRAYHTHDIMTSRASINAIRAILTNLPRTIRRLRIFEDAPPLYDQGINPMQVSDRDGSVARFLAAITQDRGAEAIAMSFAIDAAHFFSDFYKPQISGPQRKLGWLNLTSLVLTSPIMTSRRCDEIPGLLTAASRAACHMPKLEVLELYYVAPKNGAIFTYTHDKEGSTVRWKSTWAWTLPPAVISAWRETAAVHGTTKELTHKESCIFKSQVKWGGSIVSLLRTRTAVVHPITYGNMMNGLNHM
ncbi:hypothetical protein HDV57DRAFT_160289 [Trichoderma longibrachiatum]